MKLVLVLTQKVTGYVIINKSYFLNNEGVKVVSLNGRSECYYYC